VRENEVAENSEHVESVVNPYESPESESHEKQARRNKTQWRIVPTALLSIVSGLLLLGHLFYLITGAGFFIYWVWIKEDGYVSENFDMQLAMMAALFLLAVGAVGDAIGLLGARNCWKGCWLRSSMQTVVFVGMLVLTSFLIVLVMR
jgi:hypothetical protein